MNKKLLSVIVGLTAIAVVFCVVVLVVGSIHDWTFGQVLQHWFAPKPKASTENIASAMFKILR